MSSKCPKRTGELAVLEAIVKLLRAKNINCRVRGHIYSKPRYVLEFFANKDDHAPIVIPIQENCDVHWCGFSSNIADPNFVEDLARIASICYSVPFMHCMDCINYTED